MHLFIFEKSKETRTDVQNSCIYADLKLYSSPTNGRFVIEASSELSVVHLLRKCMPIEFFWINLALGTSIPHRWTVLFN